MGRKAGHLALGIGKAAGATLTLIPEEFPAQPIRLEDDRRHAGRRDHQAPELRPPRRRRGASPKGVVLDVDPEDLAALDDVERDAHGHMRIAEVEHRRDPEGAGRRSGCKQLGIKTTHRRQEHRLRAALRRSDPVRHGVHARPRLLRGQVPAGRRQRAR